MHRGYFFTLDAFIAAGVLFTGFALVYLAESYSTSPAQADFLAQDLTDLMGGTRLYEVNSPFIDEQRAAGNITNMDNTLLEQIGEFYYAGQFGHARNLTRNVTRPLVPSQYGYSMTLRNGADFLLDNRSILGNETPTLTVAKVSVLGVLNSSVIWGPYILEVLVWR